MKRIAAALILLAALGNAPASGAESAYTDLDLALCDVRPIDPTDPLESGVWDCTGYGDMPIYVAEGDLRFFVSYGPNAEEEIAATQTLPPFNYINDVLEWRLGDGGQPYATILRYYTDAPAQLAVEGQFLVVTKVGGDGVCHVAYVDARANANANDLARQAADMLAPKFRCGEEEPRWIGERLFEF